MTHFVGAKQKYSNVTVNFNRIFFLNLPRQYSTINQMFSVFGVYIAGVYKSYCFGFITYWYVF